MKVLDFGLAKLVAREAGGPGPDLTNSPTMIGGTREGVILGSAPYMSPEQARGAAVDKRTDIWAFGCVLYEMLTGARAFGGDDISETLAAVLRDEPDVNRVPARARVLLQRCLEKDPKRRLRDIGDAMPLLETVPQDGVAHARRSALVLGCGSGCRHLPHWRTRDRSRALRQTDLVSNNTDATLIFFIRMSPGKLWKSWALSEYFNRERRIIQTS